MTQGIHEQIGAIPAIEPERHFGAIGLQMLRADTMPATHDTALQERECGLDCVGVGVSFGVDAKLVADRLVLTLFPQVLRRAFVGVGIVGIQDVQIFAQVLADVLRESSAPRILGMEEAEFAAALANPNNDLFVGESEWILCFAADVGFIHFNLAVEHGLLAFDHRGADSVTQIPCRLVASESECALNLASRHALFGFAEQQRSEKPFCEWQVGIVEDRASGHRELVVTLFAVVESLFGFEFRCVHVASRAADAFRPAQTSKHLAALFIGRKHGVYIN